MSSLIYLLACAAPIVVTYLVLRKFFPQKPQHLPIFALCVAVCLIKLGAVFLFLPLAYADPPFMGVIVACTSALYFLCAQA